MDRSATQDGSDRRLPTTRISSYDQYLMTYLPKLQEQRLIKAQTPQEFGASIARQSLARIKEALGENGAA